MSVAEIPQKQEGKFKFRTKSRGTPRLTPSRGTPRLTPVKDRRSPARRKALSKNRIYLKTPDDWYKYHPDDPPDVTSPYQRNGAATRLSLNESPGRKIVYDKRDVLFPPAHKRNQPRKGMIIGERPSLWRVSEIRRPQLPGNLFVDNLRHQKVDWRKFNKVTWNDILESHIQDVSRQPRDYAQTLPQKEHWLASIDARVRYSKMNSRRDLPQVSPRLFNNKMAPSKAPVATKYISKDKQGNVFYIVGPGDVTQREYRPFVLPEISKISPTPKKQLDF